MLYSFQCKQIKAPVELGSEQQFIHGEAFNQLGYALIWYTPLPTFRHLPLFFPLERTVAKAPLTRFKSSPDISSYSSLTN